MTTQTRIDPHAARHAAEAEVAEATAIGAVRAIEVAPFVLIGLLVCPPLAILVVLVAVPLLVTALVLGLVAAVFATPYLVYEHVRGHRGHAALLTHRLRHAGRALLDLAPHRIAADARRLQPSR